MQSKKDYQKMLNQSIPYLILSLSIPAIISNLISNIYNLVDTYFVGTLGVSASGAIGIVFTLMAILQAIAFMLGQGAGTNISRRLADQDEKDASYYASVSFFTALIIGCFFLVFGCIFINPFMRLLGATETILPYAKVYGMYILVSAPAIMASLVLNNIFRYEGKTIYGMIGLSLGGVLNMAMDPLFIYGFNMGIAGAGLSTALSQYISLIVLIILFFKKSVCKLSLTNFINGFPRILLICKNGFPSFIRQCLNSIASGVLNHCAKPFGDSCISAMSIVSRVQGFLFSIGLGIGQGFQPVAGFNYQVKNYKRLKKAYWFTTLGSLTMFVIFCGISFFLSRQIIGLFIDSNEVIKIGALAFKFTCVGLIFLPLSSNANMLFQSTGQSFIASILACLRGGICFIPVILLLSHYYGLIGIQVANCVGDILAGILSFPVVLIYFTKIPSMDYGKIGETL